MKKKQFINKIKNFFQKNIISVLILALIPAGIIILINPIDFKKYQIKLNSSQINNNSNIRVYEDLNNDGKEEYIKLYNLTMGTLGLVVYNSELKSLGQYNSQFYMPAVYGINKINFEDINNDSFKEIIYFSQNNDSLYLSIFSYKELDFLLKERFISKIGLNDKKGYNYYWLTSCDINNDKNKEIYFSVIAGFSLYPRKIFRYDFANDSLITSLDVGAKQNVITFYYNKGEPFFISGSAAADNCHEGFPFEYRDTCAWLLFYDKDLKFASKPIPFTGKPSSIKNIYRYKNSFITLFHNYPKV